MKNPPQKTNTCLHLILLADADGIADGARPLIVIDRLLPVLVALELPRQVVARARVTRVIAQLNGRLDIVIVAEDATKRQVVAGLLVASDRILHVAHALEVVAPPAEQLLVAHLLRVLLQVYQLVTVQKHARHLHLIIIIIIISIYF